MTPTVVSMELNGKQLRIETGRMAKQADGAVLVSYGDSVVLVTAVGSETEKPDIDFFPLTCDYVEKFYASGKIPGGFFKREGRPSEKDVLTSRLIDRPIRPMFAEGFKCETQIIATVMSMDRQNSTDVLAVTGASAALTISSLPFLGPMACVRVGRVAGSFIANPTKLQQEQSDIDLVVAGTRDAIVMVEGGAAEISESDTVAALQFAHQSMQPLIDLQLELARLVGKEKRAVKAPQQDETLVAEIKALAAAPLRDAFRIPQKKLRYERLAAIGAETKAKLIESRGITELGPFSKAFSTAFGDLKYAVMREGILVDRVRVDGRKTDEVRPITIELGVLPRAHGSALFTRGETQALVAVTLGTSDDAQRWDLAEGESKSTFMLHYNFPPFSTGEVKFLRSPGRREVGHGALAERSLRRLVPTEMEFPYTVRVVSEILESNGSSSMASVCGGSLAMFDAAVPFKGAVAGIAMGLIMEGDSYAILSDILGDEDHLGDMDFKVAGTRKGITGLQMDIKIAGLSMDIMTQALDQALRGRLHILGKMEAAIEQPREEMSPFAPRITTIQINTEKIRDVIGPGGKVIRGIVEKTGVKIDVDDSGIIRIASSDGEAAAMAERMIREITQEAEVGKLYLGQVKKITDFGAFVEIFPGTDGLIHISQLAHGRVNKVTDVVREGDEVLVRVLEVDKSGKIRLSRKDALDDTQG